MTKKNTPLSKIHSIEFSTLIIRFLFPALLLVFSLLCLFPFRAEALENTETRMLSKTITGEVGAKMSQGFALVYKSDKKAEYEMWFPFQEVMQFIGGYNSADDLEAGDKVMVTYDEAVDGTKKILKSVNLIKKGEPPLISDAEEEVEAI